MRHKPHIHLQGNRKIEVIYTSKYPIAVSTWPTSDNGQIRQSAPNKAGFTGLRLAGISMPSSFKT